MRSPGRGPRTCLTLLLVATLGLALPAPTHGATIYELVLEGDVELREHAKRNGWTTDEAGRIHVGSEIDGYTYVSFRVITIPLLLEGMELTDVDLDFHVVHDVLLRNVRLDHFGRADVTATHVRGLTIDGLTFGAVAARIDIRDSSDVYVADIDNTAGPTELVVRGSTGVIVKDSVFRTGPMRTAVVVQDSDAILLKDLYVTAATGDGLRIDRTKQLEVKGVRLVGASGDGVRLGSVEGRVHRMTIEGIQGVGVRITGNSNVDLYNSHLSGLGTHGVLAHGTDSVTIHGNHIRDAELGIALHALGFGLVYDNWLANDANACKSGLGLARWAVQPMPGQNIRGGDMRAGNHWADADVSDSNGDGIGDRPHTDTDEAGPSYVLDGPCPGIDAVGLAAARQLVVDPFPLA